MNGQHELTRDVDVDLGGIFASIWRHKGKLLLAATLATAVAFFLVQTIDPLYKAEARVLIQENEQVIGGRERGAAQNGDQFGPSGIASQVELLRSRKIARQIIDELGLYKGEPDNGEASALKRIARALGLVEETRGPVGADIVQEQFDDALIVYQSQGARVIVVEFTADDPEVAAKVPDLVVTKYLQMQEEMKRGAGEGELIKLKPELDALRTSVRAADAAAAEFRDTNDLLEVRDNVSLATQELSELATELGRVRAQRSRTEADAAAVRRAVASGNLDTSSSVLNSQLIQRLQEQRVSLTAQLAERSTTLLDRHPVIQRLRSQIRELNGQIAREARKVQRSLEQDVATARSREQDLIAQRNRLKSESGRVGRMQVELAELERDADSKRQQLSNYLTSYREAEARQNREFVAVDAFFFSRADVPSKAFFPKKGPIVVGTFFGTLLLGAMITLAGAILTGGAAQAQPMPAREPEAAPAYEAEAERDAISPRVDAPEAETKTLIPALEAARRAARRIMPERAEPAAEAAAEPLPEYEFTQAEEVSIAPIAAPPIAPSIAPQSHAVASTTQHLVEAGPSRVIILSADGGVSGEAAIRLVRQLAERGARTVVVDLNTTRDMTRTMLGDTESTGMSDLMLQRAELGDVLHRDRGSRAHIIPAGKADAPDEDSTQINAILAALHHSYDFVVVDRGVADLLALDRVHAEGSVAVISAGPDIATAYRIREILARAGYGEGSVMAAQELGRDWNQPAKYASA